MSNEAPTLPSRDQAATTETKPIATRAEVEAWLREAERAAFVERCKAIDDRALADAAKRHAKKAAV